MSVNLMSAIFETEFRDLQDDGGDVTKASTAKLVLLAMADHANDEGEGSYPSVERLCRKTALSEQTIRNTFDALRYNGIILLEGISKYGTNNHTINTKSFPKAIGKEFPVLTLYPLDPLTDGVSPSNQSLLPLYPLYPNHPITIIESPEPVLSKEELEEVNKKVDKILELNNPQSSHWQGRENFRDNHLLYADWYNKKTNQICSKKYLKSWKKAFSEWRDDGIEIRHLESAYEQDISWRKVFTDPNELTKKAIALKAAMREVPEPRTESSGHYA